MNTIDQVTQSLKTAAPTGIPSTGNILLALWEKASPNLDQETLKWFAGATEQAESLMVAQSADLRTKLSKCTCNVVDGV